MLAEKERENAFPLSQSNHMVESCTNLLPPKVSYIVCCVMCYNCICCTTEKIN